MTTRTILEQATSTESFSAGQEIFREGEPGDVMYAIQSGEVDLFIGEMHLETVGAGNILGEMGLIDKGPRFATAVARTDCVLVPVNEEQFTLMVNQNPSFALQVMHIMVNRLRLANSKGHASEVSSEQNWQI